jgi:hypothetical protein
VWIGSSRNFPQPGSAQWMARMLAPATAIGEIICMLVGIR